jgi:hypothetical protein
LEVREKQFKEIIMIACNIACAENLELLAEVGKEVGAAMKIKKSDLVALMEGLGYPDFMQRPGQAKAVQAECKVASRQAGRTDQVFHRHISARSADSG